MKDPVEIVVDRWQIRPSADSSFGIYDDDGLVAGPFGTRDEAIMAATRLPRKPIPSPGDRHPTREAALSVVSQSARLPAPREIKHRRLTPELAIASELRVALKPIHRRINKMQLRSTFITACVPRKNSRVAALKQEARALIAAVAAEKQAIDKLVRDMPAAAASSKLFDVRSALNPIDAELRRALAAS